MPIKLLTCAALALSLVATEADDPNGLVDKAQKAQAKRDYNKAVTLLRKADAAWENSLPNAPEHAQALDLMAVLMKIQASQKVEQRGQNGYGADLEMWRNEAAPVVKRALAICEASGNAKPEDLALALEIQADILGDEDSGEASGRDVWPGFRPRRLCRERRHSLGTHRRRCKRAEAFEETGA